MVVEWPSLDGCMARGALGMRLMVEVVRGRKEKFWFSKTNSRNLLGGLQRRSRPDSQSTPLQQPVSQSAIGPCCPVSQSASAVPSPAWAVLIPVQQISTLTSLITCISRRDITTATTRSSSRATSFHFSHHGEFGPPTPQRPVIRSSRLF